MIAERIKRCAVEKTFKEITQNVDFLQEQLCGEMELANPVDKHEVSVKKKNVVAGHLPLGCHGKFAKAIFYFLRSDEWSGVNAK